MTDLDWWFNDCCLYYTINEFECLYYASNIDLLQWSQKLSSSERYYNKGARETDLSENVLVLPLSVFECVLNWVTLRLRYLVTADPCHSQVDYCEMKRKQPLWGFEIGSPIICPMTIIVTLSTPPTRSSKSGHWKVNTRFLRFSVTGTWMAIDCFSFLSGC